jgi:hypothetical protein
MSCGKSTHGSTTILESGALADLAGHGADRMLFVANDELE